jgi:hypothetical protein
LAQVQESRVYSGRQIPEPGDKERRSGILHVPDCIVPRPNVIADEEGEKDAQNLSAEDGRENTASCMKRQGDES